MEELSKAYNPAEVEQKWYKFWEENGLFKPSPEAKTPFTIVIPPPNITGSLHMGHALNNSIQDLLIRYKRMQGFRTLWVPGTDHAGIATQNVVERELKKEGKKKEDLGREKFIEKIWEWKKEYGGRITKQLRRLGASCDWSRERFTMDEGLSRAVKRHFVQLYNEGLIYRGKRIVNWCPRCGTAISDIEVKYENKKGKLWYIKYPIGRSQIPDPRSQQGINFIIVATTRPETMLGDTAVAVNPNDERYKHLHGKVIELPLVGRQIPIITDDFVDQKFGTGAVKVTPAHDPNDFEMGERHNLPRINILTPEAKITLNELSDSEKGKIIGLEGLDRFKARDKLVELLGKEGFIEKIEDYENSVGECHRCNTIVEPYLSDQWFVKIKPLAEKAIKAVEDQKIKLVPERWTKVYLQWMTNLRDWCISRQLWWGHQIPAWYKGDEVYVGEEPPKDSGWTQDPDVFDTWFSSALWPFSTLGWPENTDDLKTFYPTDVLVTSYDIIFFWVARMIMAGEHFLGKEPFHTVYFNALVKDIHGKKMSKSWGNVIDPLEVIDRAGADALRFAFLSLCAGQGQDIKLSEDKITEARNFANKIWNASRFVLLNTPSKSPPYKGGDYQDNPLSLTKGEIERGLELSDKWILSRLNQTIGNVTKYIENYNFGEAAKALYEFIWSEFCDWYIEITKIRLYGQDEKAKEEVQVVLLQILEATMKILHPFMPFETEELYQKIKGKENPAPLDSIMIQEWPKADLNLINEEAQKKMDFVMETVRAIRNMRATFSIQPGAQIKLLSSKELNDDTKKYIQTLAKISEVEISGKHPKHTIFFNVSGHEFGLPIEGLVDLQKESEKIKKEINKLNSEFLKVSERLADEKFNANATEGSIVKEKQKLGEYSERISALKIFLAAMS